MEIDYSGIDGNLLDNAIKHTLPSERNYYCVHKEKEKVWFEVIDEGTGI